MNWGTKIMLVFGVFVCGMLFMVFKASRHNMDLVTKDYYEQELKYQQTIDAVERTNALSSVVKYTVAGDNILVELPQEMKGQQVSAAVWVYCIADKNRDLKKQFNTKEGTIIMPVLPANKGLHEIKISWTAGNEQYYHSKKLTL